MEIKNLSGYQYLTRKSTMWYQDMNFSTTRGRPYCNDTSTTSLATTEQGALTNNHGLLNYNIPREGPIELTRTKAETRLAKRVSGFEAVRSTLIVFRSLSSQSFPTFTLIIMCKSSTPRVISHSSLCNGL